MVQVVEQEHWTSTATPAGDVRLFVWRKYVPDHQTPRGSVFFVHGSSMGSIPSFDLQVPGRPFMSVMDSFAHLGYDTLTMDHEGYRPSDRGRDVNADVARGVDELAVATHYLPAVPGA